jgi:hypothetical protein
VHSFQSGDMLLCMTRLVRMVTRNHTMHTSQTLVYRVAQVVAGGEQS